MTSINVFFIFLVSGQVYGLIDHCKLSSLAALDLESNTNDIYDTFYTTRRNKLSIKYKFLSDKVTHGGYGKLSHMWVLAISTNTFQNS